MDFTREPIIETVITPKEGHKIVVRNSKNPGSEEYFVDAVEIICFGGSTFFRSLERPKAFLVPASDYEILEVREARIVLKNVGLERSIKIAGGKEGHPKKEPKEEKPLPEAAAPAELKSAQDAYANKGRRDRRRQNRRRRGTDEEIAAEDAASSGQEERIDIPLPSSDVEGVIPLNPALMASLLTPPPTLISETLKSYKDNALFKEAFYTKEELSTVQTQEILPLELPIEEVKVYMHDEVEREPLDETVEEAEKSLETKPSSNGSE